MPKLKPESDSKSGSERRERESRGGEIVGVSRFKCTAAMLLLVSKSLKLIESGQNGGGEWHQLLLPLVSGFVTAAALRRIRLTEKPHKFHNPSLSLSPLGHTTVDEINFCYAPPSLPFHFFVHIPHSKRVREGGWQGEG